MNHGLRWSAAARLAWRELQSARGRFLFVVAAIALGVGALTGVRSFSQTFRQGLVTQARSLLAGDINLQLPRALSDGQREAMAGLAREHVNATRVTESVSMVAGPAGAPLLTSLKAIVPGQYPFAGSVDTTPPGALSQLDDRSVLASPDLLLRLGLRPGAPLTVGGQPFRIAGVDNGEPDRLEGGLSIGPRLLLTQGGLARTGIIQFGSQVQSRLLLQLNPGAPPLGAVEAQLRAAFPHARLRDYHNANPTVERGLDHATTFLSLISLIALIVGGVGVASAMHAHLQLRLDAIATMKVAGARTAQITRIYGLQALGLGAAGGLAGLGLSLAVARTFPWLLASYLPQVAISGWGWMGWAPALEGLAAGMLVALLFSVPALLGLRQLRPAWIFRRYMEPPRLPGPARAASAAVLLAGIALLAVGLADEPWRAALRTGAYFLVALVVCAAVLAGVSWVLLRLLRMLVGAVRMPLAARHGLANLHRPGNPTTAVLVALGLGVAFTLSVFLLQRALLADLQRGTPPGVANVFLIDVPANQAAAVQALLQAAPGREGAPELIPTTRARINGRRRDLSLAAMAGIPGGVTLAEGTWPAALGPPEIALSREAANGLRLRVGQTITLEPMPGQSLAARVSALYVPEPHRMIARLQGIAPPAAVAGWPTTINGGVRMAPAAIPGLESRMYARFPTVTVVNLADVIERVQSVVDNVTRVVHFVSFFAILAGAIILASSVAGTRFRRMREIAVLKTCGATRAQVARIFSVEFLVLGAAAGLAGALLANGLSAVLAKRLLGLPLAMDARADLAAVAAAAGLAAAAGWLASARILSLKPLDVLRGE